MSDTEREEAVGALVRDVASRLRRRPDIVFELDHPEEVVPLLPVQELHLAIQEIGLEDAVDLVTLASPDQTRAFLDLSAWTRDQINLEEATAWLEVLVELEESTFAQRIRALDPELVEALLRKLCVVVNLQLHEIEEMDDAPYTTPDRFFALLPLGPEPDEDTGEPGEEWDPGTDERFQTAVAVIDKLYRDDPAYAIGLLTELGSATATELEELAYRWRSGRLADLGYETFSEALSILQYVSPRLVARAAAQGSRVAGPDPRAVQPDPTEVASLGGVLLEPWVPTAEEAYLQACLESLDKEDLDRATQAFTFLANRLAAATLARPGEADEMREVLARARQGLNLGLEFLTQRQPEQTAKLLRLVPLVRVFQVGRSLTLKLQRLVLTLTRAGHLSLASRGFTLLDPPWRSLAEGLIRRFPELTRALNDPPAAGYEPILSLEDLHRATELVEDLGAQWPLVFTALGFDHAWLTEEGLAGCVPAEPGAVRLGDLLRTAAANLLLDRSLTVEPLDPESLADLQRLLAADQDQTWIQDILETVTRRVAPDHSETPPRLARILRSWLAPLAGGDPARLVLTRGQSQPLNIS